MALNRRARRTLLKYDKETALQKQQEMFENARKEYMNEAEAIRKDRANFVVESYLTATMLVLHDKYGFDSDKCCEVIKEIETTLINTLTNAELIEEIKDKLDIDINIYEVLDKASRRSHDE